MRIFADRTSFDARPRRKGLPAGRCSSCRYASWYARAAFRKATTERLNKPNNTVPVTRLGETRQATFAAAYRNGRWSLLRLPRRL